MVGELCSLLPPLIKDQLEYHFLVRFHPMDLFWLIASLQLTHSVVEFCLSNHH